MRWSTAWCYARRVCSITTSIIFTPVPACNTVNPTHFIAPTQCTTTSVSPTNIVQAPSALMILGFVLRPKKKLEKPVWEDSFTNYSQLRERAVRQYGSATEARRSSKQWLQRKLDLCVAGSRAQTSTGSAATLLGRFHAGTHAAYTSKRLLALPRREQPFADGGSEPRVALGVASAGLFMHWAHFENSWRSSRRPRARERSCTMPVALHLSGFGMHPLRSLVLDVLVPPVPPPPAAQRVLVISPDAWPAALMREQSAFEERIDTVQPYI